MSSQVTPLTVYGSSISYFTGKLEGYLRCKQIPYRFEPATSAYFARTLKEKTGATQVPAVELADGRWMTDTTPIIGWLEAQYPLRPIIPQDPALAFFCRLVEDYADEWLWRPAMHYRWSYRRSREARAAFLADELAVDVKAPFFLKRRRLTRRQLGNFVTADGIDERTKQHADQTYLNILAILEAVFQKRPYVLGDAPSLADIGLFGPMFRHFSMDPTPADIMQRQAPAVYEWVARLWNCRQVDGDWAAAWPDDLEPLLREIGETHLQYLAGNARAYADEKHRFDVNVQGCEYASVPVSRYRVWCVEELQRHLGELPEHQAEPVRQVLADTGCLELLEQPVVKSADYNTERTAPFDQGLAVYNI